MTIRLDGNLNCSRVSKQLSIIHYVPKTVDSAHIYEYIEQKKENKESERK